MFLTALTGFVLLAYIASFAMPLNMYARCVVDYIMLVYMGFILWKLIISSKED